LLENWYATAAAGRRSSMSGFVVKALAGTGMTSTLLGYAKSM
jgi:hypothetical protein